jgi:hypothetical protein
MPTNAERAARAERALVAYKGDEAGEAISIENITDLLTDMHHLLEREGTRDVERILDAMLLTANGHFEAEDGT